MGLFDLAKKKNKPRISNGAGLSPSLGFIQHHFSCIAFIY